MTRRVRKRFLIFATVTAQLIIPIHLAVLVYLYVFLPESTEEISRFAIIIPTGSLTFLTFILALQAAICGGALLGLSIFFRKTPSPEVFFFEFALLGFSVSSLRILAIPLALQVTSLFSLLPLTKLVFFGRLSALLCLFLSGLFSTGLTFQKQGFYLLGVLIISAILSTALPVDCTVFSPPLLGVAGDAVGFQIVFYSISVFTVLNYLYAASQHSSSDYTWNAVAVLMVITGIQLVHYYAQSLVGVPGLILLIAGTILFAQRTHSMYQWFW